MGAEIDRIEDQFRVDNLVLEDFLFVVDIVDETIQRAHALLEAALGLFPFARGYHPRNQIEGPLAVYVFAVAVNGERDAHGFDGEFGGEFFLVEVFPVQRFQIGRKLPRLRPRHTRPLDHLIVKGAGLV